MADTNHPPLPDPAARAAQAHQQRAKAQAVGGILGAISYLPVRAVVLTLFLNSEGLGVGSLVSLPDLSFAQAFGIVLLAVLVRRGV
jgi:hypothetical protein